MRYVVVSYTKMFITLALDFLVILTFAKILKRALHLAYLNSLLAGDDSLPGKQLLKDIAAAVFDAGVEVHDLVGDPDVVQHLPDVRLAAQLVGASAATTGGGSGRLRVHRHVYVVLSFAVQGFGPCLDSSLEPVCEYQKQSIQFCHY